MPAGLSEPRARLVPISALLIVAAVVIAGCAEKKAGKTIDDEPLGRLAAVTPPATPGIVIDSALPMDTLLRRFQADLEEPNALSDALSSAEALTREYLEALARSDAAALRRLHITRAEYAYLYFPTSKMMDAPYELNPDVAWLLLSAESAKGLTSVLHRFGGQRLELRRVRCPGEPLREGRNTVWRDCVVRYRGEGNMERERPLFAAIIERGGRFKFFSYATPL